MSARPNAALRRLAVLSLVSGVLGLGACVLWAVLAAAPAQLFRAYMLGFLFCSSIAVGCLGLLMMSHLTGGDWGIAARPILEAAARSVPLLAVLFAPILFGLRWLYDPARPEEPARSAYLSAPFFILRSLAYFALWTALAYLLGAWSARQQRSDTQHAQRLAQRMRALSGPGLFFSSVAVSFAATDWVMLLLPGWYSTITGMLVLVGQGLSAYAFVIIALGALSGRQPFLQKATPKLWHDLAKLLQAFVLLWAYLAFSQLLIIWTGNLPHEITWYVSRLRTSWVCLGVLLLIGHFALPFFLLLFRSLKRRPSTLLPVAGLVLFMRLCDALWLVEPNFHPDGLHLHVLDIVLPVALFSLWLAAFAQLLSRRMELFPAPAEAAQGGTAP